MTREEAIKSALKFLVRKQQEQGSCGYADNDNTHEVSWNEIIEWVDNHNITIKALEALRKVEKDIHTAIDNALMYGYGDNYINACENILRIIQKQEKCLKMDKVESEKIPNFESKEYIEQRLENYNKLLKSGILDCVKDDINIDESEDDV